MNFFKFFLFFFITLYIFGCVEKTTYSGKIITDKDLHNLNISNKNELFSKFGKPSYIDSIQNKYFYYTEMNKSKNFYDNKVEYSFLFVFELDNNDKVISSKSIDLLDNNQNIYQKKITPNNIIERGLLEKIFGGVGANPNSIPNSP